MIKYDESGCVIINTLRDVHDVIEKFKKYKDEGINISHQNLTVNDGGLNYKKAIKEGINNIKELKNIKIEKSLIPILSPFNIESDHWVDRLIKKHLGANRRGDVIFWKINDKEINFDPIEEKFIDV